MAEVIDTDSLATCRLILEEFEKVETEIETNPELWRKLSFEAHKKVCETMGDDFIDYPEFEFWFSRFARGDFELDYDRSSDPKARLSTDLPVEIFEKIGEYLLLHERMQLRHVCKDIRFQVDNWDLKLDEIRYSNANNWHLKTRSKLYWADDFGKNEDNICYPAFYRNPISFLMSVLKLPKLQVEKLTIVSEDKYWNELIEELNKSNRKLFVKKVEFPYWRSSKIDMHFMIPGVLEEIKMYLMNPTREEIFKIIESDQCQSANMLHINALKFTSNFPLDALYKCPRFTLQVIGKPADVLILKFLKKLMKKGEVQKCVIYCANWHSGQTQIMKYFNDPEAMIPNFPSLRRYPISGTNEFYEIEFRLEGNLLWAQFVHLERKH